MTWIIFGVGTVSLVCVGTAGYLIGQFNGRSNIETRSYWRGFADGELHAQLEERTPSLN